MSGLDLYQLAQETLQETGARDPEVVAKEFARRINADDFTEAFERMSAVFIRTLMADMHRRQNGVDVQGSRKVAAARRAWQEILDAPDYVPSLNSWIVVRSATRDQLLEMAEYRAQKGAREMVAAKRYRYLAAEMERTDARLAGDLPLEVVREATIGIGDGHP